MVRFIGWYRLVTPPVPVALSLYCNLCGEYQEFRLNKPDSYRQIHEYVSTACGRTVELTGHFARGEGENQEMRGW